MLNLNKINSLDESKRQVWNRVVSAYKTALDAISCIMQQNPDMKFYETENGWDSTKDRFTGATHQPMSAEELMNWIYSNSIVDEYTDDVPYIYMDSEIEDFVTNRQKYNIEAWKKSIEWHKDSIRRYEERISDVQKTLESQNVKS